MEHVRVASCNKGQVHHEMHTCGVRNRNSSMGRAVSQPSLKQGREGDVLSASQKSPWLATASVCALLILPQVGES